MWRLAPRLLEHWSATGRLDAINAAVSTTTKQVREALVRCSCAHQIKSLKLLQEVGFKRAGQPNGPSSLNRLSGLLTQLGWSAVTPVHWLCTARREARFLPVLCPQVVLAMMHGRRNGKPLQFAAARAALWLLNDLPAVLERVLFPDNVMSVRNMPDDMCAQMPGLHSMKLHIHAMPGLMHR